MGVFDDLMPPPTLAPAQAAAPTQANRINFADLMPPPVPPAQSYNAESWPDRPDATPTVSLGDIGRGAVNVVRNVTNGMSGGFADKISAARDAGGYLGPDGNVNPAYAAALEAQRAKSDAAMSQQGLAGNVEQIGGMFAPAGEIAKGVEAIGAASKAVPLLGRVLASPYAQAAATGAGVGAGNAAGNDTPIGAGAAEGALSGLGGQALGNAIGGTVGAIAGKFNPKSVIPTAEEIQTLKTAAYDAAEKAGGIVNAGAAQRLATSIQDTMAKHSYHPLNEPGGQAVLDQLARFPDPAAPGVPTGVSMEGLDTLRKLAGRMGQGTPSGAELGGKIKGVIDKFSDNIQPTDILAGDAPGAVAAYREARRLAQIGFKTDALENGVEKATDTVATTGSGGNINNKTRATAKDLKWNSGQNWTPDEAAAIENVIHPGGLQNTLRLAGKFSPEGNGLIATVELLHGLTAAGEGGVGPWLASASALPAVGFAAKHLADAGTTGKMNALGDLIRSGGVALPNAPNVVQQFAGRINPTLATAFMGAGAADSVNRAQPDSRAANLASVLAGTHPAQQPQGGLGGVFSQR